MGQTSVALERRHGAATQVLVQLQTASISLTGFEHLKAVRPYGYVPQNLSTTMVSGVQTPSHPDKSETLRLA